MEEKRCFVMMPLAGEFEDIYRFAIKPAAEASGYRCQRADDLALPGPILTEIISHISRADLVIVELSDPNPNVFYELGIAHSLAKPVIVLARDIDRIPFDIRHYRVLIYGHLRDLQQELMHVIRVIDESPSVMSPVSEALPELDRVPRSQLRTLQKESEQLKAALAAREAELDAVRSSLGQNPELLAIRDEITEYLKNLTDSVLSDNEEKVVAARVEMERLKTENESLRSAEREVRKLKQMTLVNPHWKGRNFEIETDLCFLLMPFRETWSDDVWKLIDGIVSQCGLRCKRADEQDGRVIMDDIWEGISKAAVVIADLSAKNPNVTYEVGLADVLGKQVILLSQTPDDVPFDFLGLRLIVYENSIGEVRQLSDELQKRLEHVNAK